jgi:hypothetical protein
MTLLSPDLPCSTAMALILAAMLFLGGVIAFLYSLYRDEKVLPPFDAAVGRDVWKDVRGLTK